MWKTQSFFFKLLAIATALIGGFVIYKATTWGPWAFSDSAAYVSAARNIISGKGYTIQHTGGYSTFIKEFPPLYPLLIGVFGGTQLNYISSVRFFNIILFIFFIFLIQYLFFYISKNKLFSLLGGLISILSLDIIDAFSSIMSEPLFIYLLISNFLCVLVIQGNFKKRTFSLLCVLSAILLLTRYAGIPFVVMFGLYLFFSGYTKEKLWSRLKTLMIYWATAFIPLLSWWSMIAFRFKQVGGKKIRFGNSLLSNIFQSLMLEFDFIKKWFPYFEFDQLTGLQSVLANIYLCVVISLIAFSFYLVFFKNNQHNQLMQTILLSVASILSYMVFIAISHAITIPQIDIYDRMLGPINPLYLILLLSIGFYIITQYKILFVNVLLILIFLFTVRFDFLQTKKYVDELSVSGYGYTAKEIQQSGIIHAMQNIPDGINMISNESALVLFYTNKFPIQENNFPNHRYGISEKYPQNRFTQEHAALIIITPYFRNTYGEGWDAKLNALTDSLTSTYVDDIGGVYYYE